MRALTKEIVAVSCALAAAAIAGMGSTANDVSPGESLWQNAGVYGADVQEMLVDPADPNTIWATSTWGEGLFKTTDGGGSWTAVEDFTGGYARGLAIDHNDARVMYISFGNGVYKSTDGGDHWTYNPVGDENDLTIQVSAIAVDPSNSNVVYAGTGQDDGQAVVNIYKSTDGGGTWEQKVNFSDPGDRLVKSIFVLPSVPSVVLAATGSGSYQTSGHLYRSADGGAIWAAAEGVHAWFAFHGILLNDAALYAVGGDGIYTSDDNGETWDPPVVEDLQNIASSVLHDGRIYVGGDFGLKWADLADLTTWEDIPITGGRSIMVTSIQSLVVNTPTLYIGVGQGVLKSTDGGASWAEAIEGMNGVAVWSAARIGGTLYAGTDNGLYRYAGASAETKWERKREGNRILDIASSDDRIVLVQWDDAPAWVSFSTDGGESWTEGIMPDDLEQGIAFDAVAMSGDTIFIGGGNLQGDEGYILKSDNGGIDFTTSPPVEFSAPVRDLAFEPGSTGIAYAGLGVVPTGSGEGAGLLKTIDGGATPWSSVGLADVAVNTIIVDELDPDIVYVGGTDRGAGAGIIAQSEDGGGSWNELGTVAGNSFPNAVGGVTAMTIEFPASADEERTLYAAFENGAIVYSIDSGTTWRHLADAPFAVNGLILEVLPASSAMGIKSSGDTVHAYLYAATNAGIYLYADTVPVVGGGDDDDDDGGGFMKGGGGCGKWGQGLTACCLNRFSNSKGLRKSDSNSV